MKQVASACLVALLTACNGAVSGGASDAGLPHDSGAEDAHRNDGAACESGSLTFAFHAASFADYCIGAPASCANVWLTILDTSGHELEIDRPCLADCGDCQPYGCPASCAAPQHMSAAGVERTWDGTYYASMTCGAGAACVERSCVASGHYIARMCAYRDLGGAEPNGVCTPSQAEECTDVAFDWPPSASIDGNLGARTCCPASWLMHDCAFPDGGSGFACHQPGLGCPSSLTCGEGCDSVVEGRCDGG